MINIGELPNQELISSLYRQYYIKNSTPRNLLSSHWKNYIKGIKAEVDYSGNISMKGHGFGELEHTHILNRIAHYLCNLSYFIALPHKKDILALIEASKGNLRAMNANLSFQAFRQLCSLSIISKFLDVKKDENFHVLIIGDGYGFLSSVLKKVYINSKITLVDIGKVLFFQAVNLQKIFPQYLHGSLEESDCKLGEMDFVYVPSEKLWKISGIKYRLIINISSMQEMNYASIEDYFKFLRLNATQNNIFYCCNRVQKYLLGGECIEFDRYPWRINDKHFVDEICPFYKHFFSIRPPFIHKHDGLFIHRLTNLKTGITSNDSS